MNNDLTQKYDPQQGGVTSRVRYFDGQFLYAQDFIDDQKYHIDRQRRGHRLLHVSGICEGLALKVNNGKLVVEAGTALDSEGRLLVLSQSQEISTEEKTGALEVWLVYQVTGDAIAQSNNEIAVKAEPNSNIPTLEGVKGATRLKETPLVAIVVAIGDSPSASAVCLGQVTVEGEKIIPVNDSPDRQYSGIYLPSGASDKSGVSLRSGGEPRLAVLTGSLSVTETMRVGSSLTVIGDTTLAGATLSGALTVNNTVSLKGAENSTGLTVNTNGNVGIGIDATTDEKLIVFGNTTIRGITRIQSDNDQAILELRKTTSDSIHCRHAYIVSRAAVNIGGTNQPYATDLGFRVRSSENHKATDIPDALTILHNGNVGIGTTTPTTKLHVEGGALSVANKDNANNIWGLQIEAGSQPDTRSKIGVSQIKANASGADKGQNIELLPKGIGAGSSYQAGQVIIGRNDAGKSAKLVVNGNTQITGDLSFEQLSGLERFSFFGEWVDKELDQSYVAETDGIVCASVDILSSAEDVSLMGYSPASTLRASSTLPSFEAAGLFILGRDNLGDLIHIYQQDWQGNWNWSTPQKLKHDKLDSNSSSDSFFGSRIAFSGNHVFISAPNADEEKGAVYVCQRDNQGTWNWDKPEKLQPEDSLLFGLYIGLSDNCVFILSLKQDTGETYQGFVYVYQPDNQGNWNWDKPEKLQPEYLKNMSSLGAMNLKIIFSSDCAFINLLSADREKGSVYVCQRDKKGLWNWSNPQKLQPDNLSESSVFGSTITLSDNFAFISAPNADEGKGAVYVYQRDEKGLWNQPPLPPSSLRNFYSGQWISGQWMSILGNYAFLATKKEGFYNELSIYIYQRDSQNQWCKSDELLGSFRFNSALTPFFIYKPISLTMPVKKGDSWKVNLVSPTTPLLGSTQVSWLPLQLFYSSKAT